MFRCGGLRGLFNTAVALPSFLSLTLSSFLSPNLLLSETGADMFDRAPPPCEPGDVDSEDGRYDTLDDPPNDIIRHALIQSLRTESGSQDFLRSMSMELLLREECDWGALLSHAPRALCSMGQCFVVASTPMASSIKLTGFPELKYFIAHPV
jgi:hypothetical protein